MPFEDKTLSCRDCLQAFVFSAGEQEFYASKKLDNEPKRCHNCRTTTRMKRDGRDPDQGAQVPCEQCGVITHVPFKPTGAKPVYCQQCFQQRKRTIEE
ncbi:MAG: zinc-ribbon domain containing protein [Candidatus Melainabacteria bacterium]|nr:zinc-ribbon domain containing protein [Candidatus Melainabacteria bacterium]